MVNETLNTLWHTVYISVDTALIFHFHFCSGCRGVWTTPFEHAHIPLSIFGGLERNFEISLKRSERNSYYQFYQQILSKIIFLNKKLFFSIKNYILKPNLYNWNFYLFPEIKTIFYSKEDKFAGWKKKKAKPSTRKPFSTGG